MPRAPERHHQAMEWRDDAGQLWLEAEMPGARAAFTTRQGGVSEDEFSSLNLGVLTDDHPGNVRENRLRMADALGLSLKQVLAGRQVHGADVLVHAGRQKPSPFWRTGSPAPDIDGHATNVEGLVPLVYVADCLPIALSGEGGVAMLHGGWRGLAGGIIKRGAELVRATAAAIGPGIGKCCYEVGDEVLAAFEHLGPGVADGRMLDLATVARAELERAGVAEVQSSGLCTSCETDLFFSHRRDNGRTGRQAGLIWKAGN